MIPNKIWIYEYKNTDVAQIWSSVFHLQFQRFNFTLIVLWFASRACLNYKPTQSIRSVYLIQYKNVTPINFSTAFPH